MKFIKAEDAEPGDEIILLGHPYVIRTVQRVERQEPLVQPPGEDAGEDLPTYSLWFTDGSVSDEVRFPQFLLVKRDRQTQKTLQEQNEKLWALIRNFTGCLEMDEEYDSSTLMLQSLAQAACNLRAALDERFCLSTACGIRQY